MTCWLSGERSLPFGLLVSEISREDEMGSRRNMNREVGSRRIGNKPLSYRGGYMYTPSKDKLVLDDLKEI